MASSPASAYLASTVPQIGLGNVTFAKLVIQLGYLYFVGRAFFCDTGIAALKRRDLCFQLFFQNGNLGVNIIYLFLGGGIFLQQVFFFVRFLFIFGFRPFVLLWQLSVY